MAIPFTTNDEVRDEPAFLPPHPTIVLQSVLGVTSTFVRTVILYHK